MSRRTVTRPEIRVGGFWLSSIVPQGWGELRHSTRPNGAWQVSWTIPNARTWRHPALVYGASVELMFGPLALAPATLEEPNWDSGEFVARGACRNAEDAVSLTAAGDTTTAPNTAIDEAISRGVLSWTRVGDFGTTPVGDDDGDGGLVTLQSVLDAWADENDSGWAVDNDRNLIVRAPDETTIDWLIVPGSGVLGSAAEERVDRIFVRYIDSTTGRRATESYPGVTPAGGVERGIDITDRGRMSAAKAADIAESKWSELQGRSGWTNGLTLKGGQVTNLGGTVADLALVKAGDTMRLLGVPDPRGVAHNLDVVIGDTDYDWTDDELQVNPVGMAARDDASTLEQVGNLAVDALAKASKSGGPFAEAAGTATVTVSGAAFGTEAVLFPAGKFTVAPIVEVTAANSSVWSGYVSGGLSDAGVTVGVRHLNDTSTSATVTVHWRAVQMTSTSAAG